MGCSLGPIGSPQQRTTRFRKLCYKRAGRAHGTTNPTREGNRPTNTTRPGQGLFAGTSESLLSRDFEYQTIWLYRISTARERDKKWTQEASHGGLNTGVDHEVVSSINLKTQHITTHHSILLYIMSVLLPKQKLVVHPNLPSTKFRYYAKVKRNGSSN